MRASTFGSTWGAFGRGAPVRFAAQAVSNRARPLVLLVGRFFCLVGRVFVGLGRVCFKFIVVGRCYFGSGARLLGGARLLLGAGPLARRCAYQFVEGPRGASDFGTGASTFVLLT